MILLTDNTSLRDLGDGDHLHTVAGDEDRRILDKQIRNTIKQFMQVGNTVAWAEHSGDLTKAITDGKRIIVTTIEKFPYIVPQIGADHVNNRFAIIIDEAHSGQSGRNSAQMNLALSGLASDDEMDNEDKINAMMEGRKLLNNASYFAFTATPKNKTLETFGVPYQDGDDIKHSPFHVYTMKQAIQEGFILDVLQNYTPIDSFYKLMKIVEDDPMFDKKRAQKKLRNFVESNSYTIAKKAAMMVDHFHELVIAKGKIGGQARAMVVTASIPRCIEYYYAINKSLADRHSPYKAIIAFSGEHKYDGQESALTSAAMNGFPDAKIPKMLKADQYRILIVADMFQTGFDEPLLHTMYVDKMLYDIKAVQTLSRLNRCHPKKYDTFVLDFANKPEIIEESFSRYYRATILSGETDPNKLYDLVATMEQYQVFSNEDVERLVDLYLNGAARDKLDPTLDACTAIYKQLETDDQIKFKSMAKAFCRTYGFLGAILPYGNADWERLSIFLNLLIPKLPSPREDDLSQGILETIDLESYRNEARESMSIKLEDSDSEVAPVPAGKVGHIIEPEMDLLSVILSDFNDMFGNINWNDADNVRRQILEIPAMVSRDEKYQNAMKNSDEQSARLESERALQQVIFAIMADNMELFKQFQDNPSFKKWLSDLVFNLTYNKQGKPYEAPHERKSVVYDLGRIKFNLYGNVFFISDGNQVTEKEYVRLLREPIPDQKLSVVQELKPKLKKHVVDTLLLGSSKIEPYDTKSQKQPEEEYVMMRKFGLILLKDIMDDRNSLVRREFAEFMPENGERTIREKFEGQKKFIDSDINISADQTRRLAAAIRNGTCYPKSQDGRFSHAVVLGFLEELSRIFNWDKYEFGTLGKRNKAGEHAKLSWYAVILSQWMEGHGLSYIMRKAIEYMKAHPEKFWLNEYTPAYFDDGPEHRNVVFADTLEVIENVILFSISNYFLRFSNMYIAINGEHSLDDNNWYEFVEYGTTNEITVFLQRNGFSRESANYIKDHPEYIFRADEGLKLRRTLLKCKNNDARTEAELIALNRPKLFEEEQ